SEGMGVPFLGEIPMDPGIAETSELGRAFVKYYSASPAAKKMQVICEALIRLDKEKNDKGGKNL
ncbi:MAG: ATP-binding protein, partial [Acidobacteriota bacterium]